MGTIVFIVVGILLTAFAAMAVTATIFGASKVTSEDPEVELSFTEKLAILNSEK